MVKEERAARGQQPPADVKKKMLSSRMGRVRASVSTRSTPILTLNFIISAMAHPDSKMDSIRYRGSDPKGNDGGSIIR